LSITRHQIATLERAIMYFYRADWNRFICPSFPVPYQCYWLLFATFATALQFAPSVWGQSFIVERVASGLNSPTYVTQAPGEDGSLYITELGGAIKKLDLVTGTISTFATLDDAASATGGLHTMAFHPGFQNNGKFYAAHILAPYAPFNNFVNRLDEYTVNSGGAVMLSRKLLEEEHSTTVNGSHAIDWVGFDPTDSIGDTLYATMGDGYINNSRPPTSPFGKVLSFDTSVTDPTWELVHSGLRNPWRASFDRATGDLYIGDVGFRSAEEINFAKSGTTGLDFGWAYREGMGPGPNSTPQGDTVDPIHVTTRAEGNFTITGGYLYRGPVSELQGQYIFADFVSHKIYSGEFDRDSDPNAFDGDNLANVTERQTEWNALIPGGGSIDYIVSFGEDNAGNLYIIDFGDGFEPTAGSGQIFVIQAVPEPAAVVMAILAVAMAAQCRCRKKRLDLLRAKGVLQCNT
jgi:hypothetical protein